MGDSKVSLTKKQEILLNLLRKKYTLKQASIELKISHRAAQRLFQRVQIKKHIIHKDKKKMFVGVSHTSSEHFREIRLHNIQFHIKPSMFLEKFHKKRFKADSLRFKNNTIVLGKNFIELYVLDSFYGENTDVCLRKAYDYFYGGFFAELEDFLGVVFTKERDSRVKMVRSHYAEVDNEFAADVNKRKEKFEVKGKDGKAFLVVDKSLRSDELEAVHPQDSREDMNKFQSFFQDLRENPVLLSDILRVIEGTQVLLKKQQEANTNTALELQAITNIIKILVPAPQKEVVKDEVKKQPDYVG